MKKFLIPAFVLGLAFVFTGALAAELDPAKKLFEEKCGNCHPTEKSAAVSKDPKILADTVKLMMSKKVGFISDADAKIITDYLLKIGGK
ncbi:cytochrome c [bacterium]|nr:MAG: cytochrome c [bacterium]